MGKSLISSSFSGLKKSVQEGFNVYFVEPGTIDAVTEAMMKFLESDKQKLKNLSFYHPLIHISKNAPDLTACRSRQYWGV